MVHFRFHFQNQVCHSRCSLRLGCQRRSFPHPLSLYPVVPTGQPSLTARPRSPRRGLAHDRAFSGHVPTPVPLLSPALCSPSPPRSFVHSAKPSRPLSPSAHTNREPRHRPPSTAACSAATIASAPYPVP